MQNNDYTDIIITDLEDRVNIHNQEIEIDGNIISRIEYNMKGEYFFCYTDEEDKILYHKREILKMIKKGDIVLVKSPKNKEEEVLVI